MSDDALDLGFLGDDIFTEPQQADIIEDDGARGLKFSFIGAGQCGNNMCSQLWEQGYRRVILFNTTEKDLRINRVPPKYHVIAESYDGAGKNREVGKEAARASSSRIVELMSERFKGSDFIFIVTSSGGGSGSGSAWVLAKLAVSYLVQNQGLSDAEATSRVGVIGVLPKPQEGSASIRNSAEFIRDFVDEKGKSYGHSPLIFIDNARAASNLPSTIAVSDVNPTINKIITQLLDVFNITSARHSDIATFDPQDFAGILKSGIVTFGGSGLKKIENDADIARQVKVNLTNNMLVEKLDVSTGTHSGLLLLAGDSLLGRMPQSAITLAQETITSLLGVDANKTVYNQCGVYRQVKEQLNIFTIIGGVSFPMNRLK
jgi:cell division GTPase FtsZ